MDELQHPPSPGHLADMYTSQNGTVVRSLAHCWPGPTSIASDAVCQLCHMPMTDDVCGRRQIFQGDEATARTAICSDASHVMQEHLLRLHVTRAQGDGDQMTPKVPARSKEAREAVNVSLSAAYPYGRCAADAVLVVSEKTRCREMVLGTVQVRRSSAHQQDAARTLRGSCALLSCSHRLLWCRAHACGRRCVTLKEAPPYLRRNFILTGYYIGALALPLSCCLFA